jgi:hypothetical protein
MDPSRSLDCQHHSWDSPGKASLVVASLDLGVGCCLARLVNLVDAANVGHDVRESGNPHAG